MSISVLINFPDKASCLNIYACIVPVIYYYDGINTPTGKPTSPI